MGTEDQVLGNVTKGDDYFAAQYEPKLKAWLALVEGRHANERVWKLYRSGDYHNAMDDTDYTLTRFPNHPGGLNLVCEIALATDQTSLPLSYFERALEYYPQHAFTHAQYGHYLVEIGVTNPGIVELNEALQLDPNLVQAKAWLDEAKSDTPGMRAAVRDSVDVAPPAPRTTSGGTRGH